MPVILQRDGQITQFIAKVNTKNYLLMLRKGKGSLKDKQRYSNQVELDMIYNIQLRKNTEKKYEGK